MFDLPEDKSIALSEQEEKWGMHFKTLLWEIIEFLKLFTFLNSNMHT